MTKAESVMEKIALSSELFERAVIKAKRLGRTRQEKLFRSAQNKALDREIKNLLGEDFKLKRNLTVRIKGDGEGKIPIRRKSYTESSFDWSK
jgi:predicted DNA-binding protein